VNAAAVRIRPMSLPEIGLALDWASAEGWNPGLHDAVPFHAADPEGFLVADLGGEPVAMIAATRYGADFGFIGFYIARPDARGRGFGISVWRAASARLAGRVVGLDGVIAQQHNYRKSGFALSHRNVRYEGVARACSRAVDPSDGTLLRPVAQVARDALLAYDRGFFPAPRERFLDAWIAQPGTVALALCRGETLLGYGVIRPCRVGWKIGPLFSDTPGGAQTLLDALTARLDDGATVALDVPETNREAVALAVRHGMRPTFETARMYDGPAPEVSLERTYGITSFELG
jgi:ribosomal protein S18 acetylase RimI-like enzyme